MKKITTLFESGDHKWHIFSRDESLPGHIIDSVEYLITKGNKSLLTDPGGQEIFPSVFSAVNQAINLDQLEFLFSSHQDPDIISSLPLWLRFNNQMKCYISRVWYGFIPHFGCEKNTLIPLPDEGGEIELNGLKLKCIPAHFLHSSGNFHIYDPVAKIYFSGDVGAALIPDVSHSDIFIDDFDKHIEYMKGFHQRWMPSNKAKNNWIERVEKLDIQYLCPQHGSIFKGEQVYQFLKWFKQLEVGIA